MASQAKTAGHLEINRAVYTRVDFDEFAKKRPAAQMTCCQHVSKIVQKTCHCSQQGFLQKLMGFLPIIDVLKTYQLRTYLMRDIIAGLSVGMIHIPQGMAFATLASLAPVYGLYTSFFSVILYFFFGSCKHVSVGTMAIVSLVIAPVVETEANSFLQERRERNMTTNHELTDTMLSDGSNASAMIIDTTDQELEVYKASIASALSLISGGIMFLMGILKLGALTTLMPRPFISGFTTGAVFQIITGQMKFLLGIKVKGFSGILKVPYSWIDICGKIPSTHIPTLILTLISIAILAFFKQFINERFKKSLPVPIPIEIVVLIIATVFSHFFKFNDIWNIQTVGPIPRGLPAPFMPPIEKAPNFLKDAIMAAILSLTITISMAEIVSQNEKTVDSNQEFIANGLCYGLSSFFFCFVGAAGPPRCFILASTGGKTQVVNLFTALLLLLVLLAIGPLFVSLPKTVLACIIVVALIPLIMQFKTLPNMWRLSKADFSIWIVTWASAVLSTMDMALAIGIGWSILTVALTAMNAQGVSLGQTKHQDLFAASKRYTMVSTPEGVAIYRYESSLFFSSVRNFKTQLYKATVDPHTIRSMQKKTQDAVVQRADNVNIPGNGENRLGQITFTEGCTTGFKDDLSTIKSLQAIILDCSPFAYVDLMGITTLKQLSADYDSVNIKFILANCTSNLLRKLEIDGQIGGKGEDKMCVYPTIQDALAAVKADVSPECGRVVTCL